MPSQNCFYMGMGLMMMGFGAFLVYRALNEKTRRTFRELRDLPKTKSIFGYTYLLVASIQVTAGVVLICIGFFLALDTYLRGLRGIVCC